MINVVWQGFDLGGLEAQVIAEVEGIELDVQAILEDIINEAVEDMIAILEAAATATGEARVARGGNGPGRVDSGRMRDAIRGRVLPGELKGNADGEWGWIDEVADYFIYQEYGAQEFNVLFKGMGALQGSFIKAREKFHARLSEIGLEVQ